MRDCWRCMKPESRICLRAGWMMRMRGCRHPLPSASAAGSQS